MSKRTIAATDAVVELESSASRFGFIILCPTLEKSLVKNTCDSILQTYPGAPMLCVAGGDISDNVLRELNEVCETIRGHNTITSLINFGMKSTKSMWNVIVFAGSWVRPSIYRQFDCFVKEKKDVLFQVVNGRTNFVEGSMNGIIIHKETFADVGDFPEFRIERPGFCEMELLKLLWAMAAIEKGCRFKAIMGMKVA